MAADEIKNVGDELDTIRSGMLEVEHRLQATWQDLPEDRRRSARNLLHYLSLRRHDVRGLQDHLAALGLSSLGRAESQALASVQTVLDVIRRLPADHVSEAVASPGTRVHAGRALLKAHTDALFGAAPAGRDVRIMVTMPSEAAHDGALVRDLVASGMDCMRINTAHDDEDAWGQMVARLRGARRDTRRECRLLMDLAGPKLRTGAIEPGPPVLRWRPRRNVLGRVVAPARIWLTPRERPVAAPEPGAIGIPVSDTWLWTLEVGDRISLVDARDAKRELTVVGRADGGIWAESDQTAYVLPGTSLWLPRHAAKRGHRGATVGDLPRTAQSIVLKRGDSLLLSGDLLHGRPAVLNHDGVVVAPACIGVTLPDIFDDVRPGEAIWFDDGRIGGTIRAATREHIDVEITHAKPDGSRLDGDKGVNLPDTNLRLPALTAKDIHDLTFITTHADIVGYSFVRTDSDVRELQAQIAARGRPDLGLILKIETRRAFEQLPALLIAAMYGPSAGVMIARGDLAVECGYERLAEVQEEILWMAEASHIPVIWATQVLERLAKDGIPSRAEITDAAMGERAECVMLNKGPYILDAVRALDSILRRMQAHQRKKSALLRQLGLADTFLTPRLGA
jgi:pyruvate kinase